MCLYRNNKTWWQVGGHKLNNYLAHLQQENHRIFHSATGTDQFAMYLESILLRLLFCIISSTHVLITQRVHGRGTGGSIRHTYSNKQSNHKIMYFLNLFERKINVLMVYNIFSRLYKFSSLITPCHLNAPSSGWQRQRPCSSWSSRTDRSSSFRRPV